VSTLTKVFVVLTSVLAIALSCLFVAAAAQWDNWRGLAQQYQTDRDAAITLAHNTAANMQAALAMKDDALAALTRDLDAAQTNLQKSADEVAALKSQLAQTENQRLALDASRKKLEEMLDVTMTELKGAQKQNQSLLAENIDLQSRNARLNSRTLELTTEVNILRDETRNIQEKLYACERQNAELQSLAAGRPAAPTAPEVPGAVTAAPAGGVREIRGKIIDVKDSYASIDVGETSGVVPGMTFMVYREGAVYLGDLVIDRVRPKEAGGRLVQMQNEIRVGDLVAFGVK